MATIPAQPPSQQPPAGPMAEPDDEPMEGMTGGGYTVCVRVSATGELSVGVERGDNGYDETEDESASFTPAASKKEALTLALELLNNGGKPPVPEDEAAFEAGFASRGMPK